MFDVSITFRLVRLTKSLNIAKSIAVTLEIMSQNFLIIAKKES